MHPTTQTKALSNPYRWAIINTLLVNGEMSVNSILEVEAFRKISQPAMSQALRKLLDAKLVQCKRKGKNIFYSVPNEKRAALMRWVLASESLVA